MIIKDLLIKEIVIKDLLGINSDLRSLFDLNNFLSNTINMTRI